MVHEKRVSVDTNGSTAAVGNAHVSTVVETPNINHQTIITAAAPIANVPLQETSHAPSPTIGSFTNYDVVFIEQEQPPSTFYQANGF